MEVIEEKKSILEFDVVVWEEESSNENFLRFSHSLGARRLTNRPFEAFVRTRETTIDFEN